MLWNFEKVVACVQQALSGATAAASIRAGARHTRGSSLSPAGLRPRPQFLIDKKGRVVNRYWPLTPPAGMEKRVQQLLEA